MSHNDTIIGIKPKILIPCQKFSKKLSRFGALCNFFGMQFIYRGNFEAPNLEEFEEKRLYEGSSICREWYEGKHTEDGEGFLIIYDHEALNESTDEISNIKFDIIIDILQHEIDDFPGIDINNNDYMDCIEWDRFEDSRDELNLLNYDEYDNVKDHFLDKYFRNHHVDSRSEVLIRIKNEFLNREDGFVGILAKYLLHKLFLPSPKVVGLERDYVKNQIDDKDEGSETEDQNNSVDNGTKIVSSEKDLMDVCQRNLLCHFFFWKPTACRNYCAADLIDKGEYICGNRDFTL
ncbi:MAG: hypothetical protein MHMPM18_001260 [Marteilia pararefringens]